MSDLDEAFGIKPNKENLSEDFYHVYIEGTPIHESSSGTLYISTIIDGLLCLDTKDILGKTPPVNDIVGFFISSSAPLWKCSPLHAGRLYSAENPVFRIDEENIPPQPYHFTVNDPSWYNNHTQSLLNSGKSLEGACKVFSKSCEGGGSFLNNCAHYLSNCLIKTGFSELTTELNCVNARCNEENTCNLGTYFRHRIIRAKELRCWFASKASSKQGSVEKDTGFWATYQERASDGQGHVAILDTNSWVFYGTGWYPDWKQEYYQWVETNYV